MSRHRFPSFERRFAVFPDLVGRLRSQRTGRPGLALGIAGLALLVAVLAAPNAQADIPPPDVCHSEGTTCHNAGSSFDQGGTCRSATCQRAAPDGSVEYSCLKCMKDGRRRG